MKKFKILPIFIFIAVLSFSVRLVEVIDGVVSFAGSSAYAESEKAEELKDQMVQKESDQKNDIASDDAGVAQANDGADFPIWRDPADDDPAYESSRMEVFKDLSKRRDSLLERERSLETRAALLQAAEQEFERKFQELEQLRVKLEGLLEQQSDEEGKRIASLVKIYEGMKPKDAARIFDTLDLDILVNVVADMSERKLSPVLAAMNAERARTVTIMLAEQKQLPVLP